MLTADLVRPLLRQRGTELGVEMIAPHDTHWQQTASDLIALFRQRAGSTLHVWEDTVNTYEGERTDYIMIRGLVKVLCDAATFVPQESPIAPAQLRERLFTQGPAFARPQLFQTKTRQEIIQEIATELETTIEQIEEAIFADRAANYILRDVGPGWSPEELIMRYNLELARGV